MSVRGVRRAREVGAESLQGSWGLSHDESLYQVSVLEYLHEWFPSFRRLCLGKWFSLASGVRAEQSPQRVNVMLTRESSHRSPSLHNDACYICYSVVFGGAN